MTRRLFRAWRDTRRSPSARDLLAAVIDRADLVQRWPLGGGVLQIDCSQQLLDELAIFDSGDLEDDERERG